MKDEDVAIILFPLMFALKSLLKNSDDYDWIEDEPELLESMDVLLTQIIISKQS